MSEEQVGTERPQRAKYWSEKTPEEKIEQMADVMDRLHQRIVDQENIIVLLRDHSHDEKGEIRVPFSSKQEYRAALPRATYNILGRERR